jgi:hypothetical protein
MVNSKLSSLFFKSFSSVRLNSKLPAVAGFLLAISIFLPIWAAIFFLPPYPEKRPILLIYLDGHVDGDLTDVDFFSRMVGMKFPPKLPALIAAPYFTGLVALTCLLSAFKPKLLKPALFSLVALLAGLTFYAQWNLWLITKSVDSTAPFAWTIKDAFVPLVGPVFLPGAGGAMVLHILHLGGIFMGLASLLMIITFIKDVRKRKKNEV